MSTVLLHSMCLCFSSIRIDYTILMNISRFENEKRKQQQMNDFNYVKRKCDSVCCLHFRSWRMNSSMEHLITWLCAAAVATYSTEPQPGCHAIFHLSRDARRETPVTAVTRKPCFIGCARVELMSSRGDGFLTDWIHWMNLSNNWIEYVFNCIISIKLSPFFFGCMVFCSDPLKASMCWRSDEKVSEHGRSSAFRLTNIHRIISLNLN